jgi:hypothetical protein
MQVVRWTVRPITPFLCDTLYLIDWIVVTWRFVTHRGVVACTWVGTKYSVCTSECAHVREIWGIPRVKTRFYKKKILASVYNGNKLHFVRNKSFYNRVILSSDSLSEGRGTLEACETLCFLIISYKEKNFFIIFKYFTKFIYPLLWREIVQGN